jgi:hypothetical protein
MRKENGKSKFAAAGENAMKVINAIAVLLAGLALTPSTVAAANTRSPAPAAQPSTSQAELQIIRQLRAIQAQLGQQEQLLKKRLAYAEQLRQRALEQNDGQSLKQAEQLERQAVTQYQQWVAQLERFDANAASAPGGARRSTGASPNASPSAVRTPASGANGRRPSAPQGFLRRLMRSGGY